MFQSDFDRQYTEWLYQVEAITFEQAQKIHSRIDGRVESEQRAWNESLKRRQKDKLAARPWWKRLLNLKPHPKDY